MKAHIIERRACHSLVVIWIILIIWGAILLYIPQVHERHWKDHERHWKDHEAACKLISTLTIFTTCMCLVAVVFTFLYAEYRPEQTKWAACKLISTLTIFTTCMCLVAVVFTFLYAEYRPEQAKWAACKLISTLTIFTTCMCLVAVVFTFLYAEYRPEQTKRAACKLISTLTIFTTCMCLVAVVFTFLYAEYRPEQTKWVCDSSDNTRATHQRTTDSPKPQHCRVGYTKVAQVNSSVNPSWEVPVTSHHLWLGPWYAKFTFSAKTFAFFNSAINPLVYAGFNDNFRQEVNYPVHQQNQQRRTAAAQHSPNNRFLIGNTVRRRLCPLPPRQNRIDAVQATRVLAPRQNMEAAGREVRVLQPRQNLLPAERVLRVFAARPNMVNAGANHVRIGSTINVDQNNQQLNQNQNVGSIGEIQGHVDECAEDSL